MKIFQPHKKKKPESKYFMEILLPIEHSKGTSEQENPFENLWSKFLSTFAYINVCVYICDIDEKEKGLKINIFIQFRANGSRGNFWSWTTALKIHVSNSFSWNIFPGEQKVSWSVLVNLR